MPSRLQEHIKTAFGCETRDDAIFRPKQATLAIGLKSDVYIGHHFVQKRISLTYGHFTSKEEQVILHKEMRTLNKRIPSSYTLILQTCAFAHHR